VALVVAGTHVPVQTLIDYPEAGETLGRFLEGLPTAGRERAEACLRDDAEGVEPHV
jgi:uncharacterized protein (DUF433 family)